MFRRGSDLMGESVAINNLSQVAIRQGDMDAAVELYRRGLELDRELANSGARPTACRDWPRSP